MARRVVVTDPSVVRGLFAAHVLEDETVPALLGSVRLHQHQRDAVARIHKSLEEFGGALLADAVGLGKTFVALAVARSFRCPHVIAPAVLRETWTEAAQRSGTSIPFTSMESLSRRTPASDCDFLIVDEAHHFRSRNTRRYASLARLAARTRLLLLSATPIHNRPADLASLLALFAGDGVRDMKPADLARCMIRRHHSDTALRLPALARQQRVEIPAEREILRRLMSLPPPLPPRDGHSSPTLVSLSLAHAWSSSDAALMAALRRRLARGSAMRDALVLGRLPTSRELRAWTAEDDAMQLAFPELLVANNAVDAAALLPVLDAHLAAVKRVLAVMRRAPSRDDFRRDALRAVRHAHPGAKVVAFSLYAETVRALYRLLAADGGVAALSAARAHITSGPLARDELLRQFRTPRHAREEITLLLTTDLLSEGVNLPEASVIVHIDLPWTAARLEQRIGRARRLGASSPRISTFAFTQPPEIERVLHRELLIRRKAFFAARYVGELSLKGPAPVQPRPSAPRSAELLRALLRSWYDPGIRRSDPAAIHVASVPAAKAGFVALLSDGARTVLLSGTRSGRGATSDPADVFGTLSTAQRDSVPTDAGQYRLVRREIDRWLAGRAIADLLHPQGAPHRVFRVVLQRLGQTLAHAPLQQRSVLAGRVARVRASLAQRVPIGMQRRITEAQDRTVDDMSLLAELEEVLDGVVEAAERAQPTLIGLLLLRSAEPAAGRE